MTPMALDQLLSPWLDGQSVPTIHIQLMTNHSAQVEKGTLFLAYQNQLCDRADFIAQAVEQGAVAIVVDAHRPDFKNLQTQFPAVKFIEISNLAQCYGDIAARFYGDPTQDMLVIGVTGTNGKSSTAYFIAQALNALGKSCAFIGTIGIGVPGQLKDSPLTTLDPITCQKVAAELKQQGVEALAIEMSSHALDQDRLQGMHVNASVLTQITSDHLDYHQTLENYKQAKEKCMQLPGLQKAILNIDDLVGSGWVNKYAGDIDMINYGAKDIDRQSLQYTQGYLQIKEVTLQAKGIQVSFLWQGQPFSVTAKVMGRFNAENIAATVGVLCAYGYTIEQIQEVVPSIYAAPGRMQYFGGGLQPAVYVDYAHTTDGLAKALAAARDHHPNARLIAVFGCGGDRDTTKRAPMGWLAAELADVLVLTSDNPRTENPQQIVNQIKKGVIQQGFDLTKLTIESNREKAIYDCIIKAKPTDVLLIAGRGHERTIKLNGYTLDCDDRAIVAKALNHYREGNA